MSIVGVGGAGGGGAGGWGAAGAVAFPAFKRSRSSTLGQTRGARRLGPGPSNHCSTAAAAAAAVATHRRPTWAGACVVAPSPGDAAVGCRPPPCAPDVHVWGGEADVAPPLWGLGGREQQDASPCSGCALAPAATSVPPTRTPRLVACWRGWWLAPCGGAQAARGERAGMCGAPAGGLAHAQSAHGHASGAPQWPVVAGPREPQRAGLVGGRRGRRQQ